MGSPENGTEPPVQERLIKAALECFLLDDYR